MRVPRLAALLPTMALATVVLGGAPSRLASQQMLDALFPQGSEAWQASWWAEWEMEIPGDKDTMLSELGLCGDPAEYHFVDFSGDGVIDLIYSGGMISMARMGGACTGVAEGTQTVLFENRGGTLTRIFREDGHIVWMTRPAPWAPISQIVLRFDGCCGDLYSHLMFYGLSDADSVRFTAYDHITLQNYMQPPAETLEPPQAFVIAQERYNLRASPEVLDFADNPEEFVGEFGRGARGVALGARADTTGRTWWFVVMDPASTPNGRQPANQGRLAGWMSARFLERVDPTPARVKH